MTHATEIGVMAEPNTGDLITFVQSPGDVFEIQSVTDFNTDDPDHQGWVVRAVNVANPADKFSIVLYEQFSGTSLWGYAS